MIQLLFNKVPEVSLTFKDFRAVIFRVLAIFKHNK